MDSLSFPRRSVIAIKLRKKLPLLLERVGVRRIKIRKKALFDPLILTFSRREKGLSILNLMAVTPERGNDVALFISDAIPSMTLNSPVLRWITERTGAVSKSSASPDFKLILWMLSYAHFQLTAFYVSVSILALLQPIRLRQ